VLAREGTDHRCVVRQPEIRLGRAHAEQGGWMSCRQRIACLQGFHGQATASLRLLLAPSNKPFFDFPRHGVIFQWAFNA
jgi:hypothetical protein